MKNIWEYIKEYATDTIIQRGKEIFSNRANLKLLRHTTENFSVKIQSSTGLDYYKVDIDILSDDFSSKCDCPYGDFCKHEVAAFFLLAERSNQPILTTAKSSNANLYNKTSPTVKYHDPRHTVVEMPYLNEYKILEFTAYDCHRNAKMIRTKSMAEMRRSNTQELSAKVTIKKINYVVVCKQVGTKLETSCTCNENLSLLCTHKAGVLLQLLDEDGDEAFGMMKNWDAEKSKMLAEYGFSINDNWEMKFKFGLTGGKPHLTPLDKNLVKIGSTEFFNKLSALQQDTPFSIKPAVQTKKIENKTETLAYVFTLLANPEKNLNPIAIEPMLIESDAKGKPKSAKKLTGYRNEDFSYVQLVDEKDKEIISLQSKLEESRLSVALRSQGLKFKTGYGTILLDNIEAAHLQAATSYVGGLYRKIFRLLTKKDVYLNKSADNWATKLFTYTVSDTGILPKFTVKDNDGFLNFSVQFFVGENQIPITDIEVVLEYAVVGKTSLYPIKDHKTFQALSFAYTYPTLQIPPASRESFMTNVVYPLLKNFAVDMPFELDIQAITTIETPLAKLFLEEDDKHLKITPLFEYEYETNKKVNKSKAKSDKLEHKLSSKQVSAANDADILFEEEGQFYNIKRNRDYEQEMHNYIANSNENLVEDSDNGVFWLSGEDFLKNNWFLDAFEQFRGLGFEILGFNNLKSFKYNQHRPNIAMRASSGIDWFDLKIEISFGEQIVSLKDVKKALINKEHFVRLGDGTIGILPQDWIEKYSTIFKHGNVDKDGVKLSKIHFSILDELTAEIDNEKLLRELAEKKEKLQNFEKIKATALPTSINAQLRDYQVHGYQWLNFLDEFGWGGCLADDMGLGKTLQMLTFLKGQIDKHPTETNLVVVPTSLVYNWANEIAKFVPDIKFLVHYGTTRSKEISEDFSKYNLVITSYGILVNEIENFTKFKFRYVILDEAQAIKNVSSQRYKAVNLLHSYNKLTMTGTPVENNVSELYAQMNFANQNILGGYEFFKTEYGNEIDRHGNQEKVLELKKIVYPFILRRTKEQVAKDLPEKTETILYCEMNNRQRGVYEAFRNKYRDNIMGVIEEKGLSGAGMAVLEGLMKLRQICDSPSILNEKDKYAEDSTKLDELMTHILEIAPNHKILVFSQFIGMLDLVKRRLHTHHIPHLYLDGQTQDRQKLVDTFQNNDTMRVFLMSLKAGGVGLNLTAAEYVFLIDPWWNPAVEQQAIDRTHRIGQENKVFAYKMICKDTIEEKILQLQEKKKMLADDMISTETNVLKKLSKEDIQDLFS
jgi:non-specific serine/threonine protein kinase